MKRTNILVLGADGFIGSNLVKSLQKDEAYKIFTFDLFKNGVSKNINYFDDNLIMVHGNFLNKEDLKNALKNIDGSQGIIPIFLNLIRQNKPITIFGDGENIRDYIFIDDLINITRSLFLKETKHKIYNVGSGKGESINKIVDIIAEVVKHKIIIENKPARLIDVKKIILDTSRIVNETNYVLKISMEEGIKKTWDWIKSINIS